MSEQPGTDLSGTGPERPITRQCTAHRKNGDRCRVSAIKGGTVCAKHGGSAPQTVAAARRRLLAAAEPLMANLIKIATSSDDEALRLRATMDALTRAGITERTTVQVEVNHTFDDLLAGIVDDAVKVRRESGQGRALPAAEEPTPEESDAADARELAAVDDMAETSARDASDQERLAAASGGETVGPWGTGARPDADGHYTVTRLPQRGGARADEDGLPSYLRDPDARGRADFTR